MLAAGQGLLPQLAKSAGVTARTIKRFEALDKVPPSHSSTLLDVKAALEAAGIEFIGSPTGSARYSHGRTPPKAGSRNRSQ